MESTTTSFLRRSLLEFSTIADDIPRLDPNDGFEEYKGGFDPDEEAYAYSLGFLAIPGVALAALSLLVPIFFFLIRILCCTWRKGGGCWPTAKRKKGMLCPIVSIGTFTIFVLVGSIIIYIYGAASTESVNDFTDSLVVNTKLVIKEFVDVSDALVQSAAKLNTEVSVVTDLTKDAIKLQGEVDDFQKNLNDIFEIIDLAFMIAACVFLFFGLVTFISSACKWRSVAIVLTLITPLISVIAWISMAASFPLTSLFADVCNESLEYLADPTNSTITDYIPCPDRNTSVEALEEAYKNIVDLTEEVNKEITASLVDVNNAVAQCDAAEALGNTIPGCTQAREAAKMEMMCVPFVDCSDPVYSSSQRCTSTGEDRITKYALSACPFPTAKNKVTLQEFASYYEPYSCRAGLSESECRAQAKPISAVRFAQMVSYAEGAAGLVRVLPETESLVTCQFVKRTLKDLTKNHCDDCVKNLDTLWIGFTLVGVGLFVLWFLLITAQARMVKLNDQAFELEMGAKP